MRRGDGVCLREVIAGDIQPWHYILFEDPAAIAGRRDTADVQGGPQITPMDTDRSARGGWPSQVLCVYL